MKRQLLAALVAASLFAPAAQADIILVNRDGAGVGLNDPTARAPEGGNPGTTVGEQRRIVYEFAAQLWGSILTTDVDVRVGASFAALNCNASSAVLGSAGAWYVNWNFDNAEFEDTSYNAALANQIAGSNLNAGPDYVTPNDQEIGSQFNANLGKSNCLAGSGWYYGLDGTSPPGQISFLDVVMHEIGHGLGMQGWVGMGGTAGTPGALGGRLGLDGLSDIYTHNAYDNVTGARYDDAAMTDTLRFAAIQTPGRTSWDGTNAKAQVPLVLGPIFALQISGSVAANYTAYGVASFGPEATSANFNGDLVIVNDGAGADTADACEPLAAGSLTGKVAFINRGTCSFEPKTVNAQNAGAIAVIIGNVPSSATPGTAPGMADDPTVVATIPALSLNLNDANAIRTAASTMHAFLGDVPGTIAGADSGGRALLYTPTAIATGSTFSHVDISLTPNALMEPFSTDSTAANFSTDLTPALFQDEGWVLQSGTAKLGSKGCDTKVPLLTTPGIMTGANLQAADDLCSATYPTTTGRKSCIGDFAKKLKAEGLITSNQLTAITNCSLRP